jgi:hypothetical protein
MLIECVLLSASLCHAVKDKPVMELTAAHAASAIADGITTKQFERRGYAEGQSAWILGQHPGVPRMSAVWGAEVLIETVIAERMHRSHTWVRHVWWLPQMVAIGIHTEVSITDSRLVTASRQ